MMLAQRHLVINVLAKLCSNDIIYICLLQVVEVRKKCAQGSRAFNWSIFLNKQLK